MSSAALAPETGAEREPDPAVNRSAVLGGLIMVLLLAALDGTIVATALPTILTELGGLEHLAWVVTAYLLAQTAVIPLYGKLGDLYGRKRVLQGAVIIFLLGSALCGLSRDLTQLIGFRAIHARGAFRLETIVPGLYPGRTRHIHVKVQAPGEPILTTQLFFPGEERNASDGIYDDSLLMRIEEAADGNTGRSNFVLDLA
jgi:MFS family permease